MDRSGLMYAMSGGGGAGGDDGTVFALDPHGAVQVIYDLGYRAFPTGGGLSEDKKGNLYGAFMTYNGQRSPGTIFELVK
jgi:hypothetical protein